MKICKTFLWALSVSCLTSGHLLCVQDPAVAQVTSEQRILASFSIEGQELIVHVELARLDSSLVPQLEGGRDLTIASYRIESKDASIHVEREYSFEVADYGFVSYSEVKVFLLELSHGTALVVDHFVYPSAPGSGQDRQLFAWDDGRLQPVGKPLTGYGHFGDLPKGTTPRSFRLLPGDVLPFAANILYFAVAVPIRVSLPRTGGERVGSFGVALEIDPGSGLTVFPVTRASRYHQGDEEHEVSLYRSPTGPEAEQVRVSANTDIEFGPAYGEISLQPNEEAGVIGLGPKIMRLRVKIDGREGFVEEPDYFKLGLGMVS